jgi:Holliday junction resolvasome RuvABC endonuclease subunit
MPRPKAYLGCDPGQKGNICLLVPDEKIIEFFNNDSPPITIVNWLHDVISSYDVQMIMIEDVHSIFGTSAKSNFNFGFNVGLMHGVFRATSIGLDLVKPKEWQKFIGVKSKGKDIKKEVAQICQRLYPTAELHGPKGGLLDGRSDALMITYYCMQKHK